MGIIAVCLRYANIKWTVQYVNEDPEYVVALRRQAYAYMHDAAYHPVVSRLIDAT